MPSWAGFFPRAVHARPLIYTLRNAIQILLEIENMYYVFLNPPRLDLNGFSSNPGIE